jgi:hypothetical protein
MRIRRVMIARRIETALDGSQHLQSCNTGCDQLGHRAYVVQADGGTVGCKRTHTYPQARKAWNCYVISAADDPPFGLKPRVHRESLTEHYLNMI